MFPVKKILFPTDFSKNADTALTWALMLAKNLEAELHMLHAVVLHNDDVGDEVMQRFPDVEKCVDMLHENAGTRLEKELPDKGVVTIEKHVVRGIAIDEEISRFAEKNEIDLIVMGTHGRTGFKKFFLGSVTERVIRHAHMPILTIREGKRYTEKTDIFRLIVPVDFSEQCKHSVETAVTFAGMLKAKLEFVHVVDSSVHPAFYSVGVESPLQLDSSLVDRVKGKMQEFTADFVKNEDTVFTVTEGNPANEISKIADSHTNAMIVIASHGAGALERLFLGSTTERVVRTANSPVLTVRSELE